MGKALLEQTDFSSAGKSAGLNFGTELLVGGFETWPRLQPLPESLEQMGAEILAFDALVQNPDRRDGNPNILWKAETIFMIDHELGFSFLDLIGAKPEPWKPEAFKTCLVNTAHQHVFYQPLRGKELKLNRFASELEKISEMEIKNILGAVPEKWQTDQTNAILKHLLEVTKHLTKPERFWIWCPVIMKLFWSRNRTSLLRS